MDVLLAAWEAAEDVIATVGTNDGAEDVGLLVETGLKSISGK